MKQKIELKFYKDIQRFRGTFTLINNESKKIYKNMFFLPYILN